MAVLRDDLRPEIPEDTPLDYKTLMCEAWNTDPSVRPNFLEMMTRLDSMAENSSHSHTGQSWTSSSTAAHRSLVGSQRYDDDDSVASSERSFRGTGMPVARAPNGEVAIVFTDIVRALALWDFNPAAMRDATMAHNNLLRSLLPTFDGYEVAVSKYVERTARQQCVIPDKEEFTRTQGWHKR